MTMKSKQTPKSCRECVEFFMCKAHYYGSVTCLYLKGIEEKVIMEMEKEYKKDDVVNEPDHYKHGTYQTIDEMVIVFGIDATIQFCRMNAWKYRARAPFKGNTEQDMAKANCYLEMAAQLQKIKDENFELLKGEV